MAEQEVVKHTKLVYKIWNSKEHGFWHKFKEFIIEILIIVFAVSLSIWLHERSEHSHQQKEVKEFLVGLRSDLKQDIAEMENDRKSFVGSLKAFQYVTSLKPGQVLNTDSLANHSLRIFNATVLVPNNGRFEGFKSAGKIGFIENEKLQADIMDLYQEDIPFLILQTTLYNDLKQKLKEYCIRNAKRTATGSNLNVVLSTDEAQNWATNLLGVGEIIHGYDRCIARNKKIIGEIEKEYGIKPETAAPKKAATPTAKKG